MTLEVRRLRASDPTKAFRCGHNGLDYFLRKYALANDNEGLSATWVCVDGLSVAGFVTVVAKSVEATVLQGAVPNLPAYPVPVLLLARMGAAKKLQKKGIGRLLLRPVYQTAVEQAGLSGCAGVFTDAKPDAVGFYTKVGFVVVRAPHPEDDTTGMFMPLAAVRAALLAA